MATFLRGLLQRWLGPRAGGRAASEGPVPHLPVGDLFLSPAGESRERGAQVLGERGPSEHAALLVVPCTIRDAAPQAPDDERDYGPCAETEWTLDLRWPRPVAVTTAELNEAFRGEGAGVGRHTLYGVPAGGGRWTYVNAAGASASWRAVAIATELLDPTDEDGDPVELEALQSFQADVEARAAGLGGAEVTAREPAEVAAERARRFAEVRREAGLEALLVLQAPDGGFEGRQAWDALTSLGLEWGDMDLFHWNNRSEIGHDTFFDVWTSTPPGYFLPEPIRAGGVLLDDLVFGFRIARTADPHAILSQMVEAVRYVQGRLGGTLEAGDGAPYREDAEHQRVRLVVERLARAGLRPGTDTVLRLF